MGYSLWEGIVETCWSTRKTPEKRPCPGCGTRVILHGR
uniref:Uncharacterized protein n=1 Tax=Chloracidobacterium thermophilum TaxID=458033 RepID=A8DJD4_9BACT|nr:hypothetical protein YS_M60-F11.027 [Chloracidobacterium thermophilum]